MSAIIFSPSRYDGLRDVRLGAACGFCARAKTRGVQVVMCDASPDPAVREALQAAGAHVFEQGGAGRKGVALREALAKALELAAAARPPTTDAISLSMDHEPILVFCEAEKETLPDEVDELAAAMNAASADLAVCGRGPRAWASYPREQFHSESFANALLNAELVAAKLRAEDDPPLDLLFGPFALRASLAPVWLRADGDMWDAQLLPLLQAIAQPSTKTLAYTLSRYEHPVKLKQEEEGSLPWVRKRWHQLQVVLPPMLEEIKLLCSLRSSTSE